MQETHRSGHLKQKNKAHKTGRHRSKGEIDTATKGKVSVKLYSKKLKQKQNKNDRRYQASQLRLKKREETLMKKRKLGGPTTPPLLVSVVTLGFNPEPMKLLNLVMNADSEAQVAASSENIFHVAVPRWKERFAFILPPKGNLYATLDALKVSDSVVFVLSAETSDIIDDVSEKLLSILLAQGLPSVSIILLDLESKPLQKRGPIKQEVQKCLSRWFPDEKVVSIEKDSDGLVLLRRLSGQKRPAVHHRDSRPHMIVETITTDESSGLDKVTVKVSGYLRGKPLSVDELIHIPGWGDFQMKQIDGPPDPFAFDKPAMDADVEVLQVCNPSKQASLIAENVPDPMDAEQTWPSKEELEDATKAKKNVKRVPKGTSDYQACWIPDDPDDLSEIDEEDEEMAEDGMEIGDESNSDTSEWEEREELSLPNAESDKYDATIDVEEEGATLETIRAAREEVAFPDEMDTPQDIPARERFVKYRGLASFRTSPWDPKENLPIDYAKIFQFENFDRTKRRVMKELDEKLDTIPPGGFLTIHVQDVPRKLLENRTLSEPLVLFGLLPHEHKMSVINLVVKRSKYSTLAEMPVKSKEPVIVHCGFRRFRTRPIYSQHTNGSKHKFERFFQPGATVVATVYAPIMYPPAPVIMFADSGRSLIGTGRVLSVDPDRLIMKRVILSGHPFRVLKHSAIIRFMFFNREDIDWFKPVELRTKHGRRGHIKEPLGTHGHMKAVFDDQLKSQDTVLMHLYKRVFPPWFYEEEVPKSPSLYKVLSMIPEETPQEMES